MKITEKQIMQLIALAHHLLSLATAMHNDDLKLDIVYLLTKIHDQQSEELKEIT